MKMLKFRLWGDYAHFKKYYTTTSPLTFEFPPPPTLAGIISAIIGLDKTEYLNRFQQPEDFRLAIRLNGPVQKVRWTINLIGTNRHFWRIYNRTQIRTEFLKNPDFTIFFWHRETSIYNLLKQQLENHASIYTVSLGLSELLANFEFLGECEMEAVAATDFVDIDSVIPAEQLTTENAIDFEKHKEIFRVNFPLHMRPDRVVTRRSGVLFERNAQSIRCQVPTFWKSSTGEQIVFI